MPWPSSSSTWARWVSDSFWASLKTTLTLGCCAAACLMSSSICTRQGSPRLHWLMPMTKGSAGVPACFLAAGDLPGGEPSARVRAQARIRGVFFIASSGGGSAALLEERRADDDGAREHQPGLGAEGVEAEDLAQVADGEHADQRQADAAAAA